LAFQAALANSQSSPVCEFIAIGGGGSVALLGFAKPVLQVPVGSPYRSWLV